MAPRHINPSNLAHAATAPYNFVPLPNAVLAVKDGDNKPWRRHDQFHPGTYSGWIDLKIKTLSPLYIRSSDTKTPKGKWDPCEARFRSAPFCRPDGRPAIPGATLRGAIRTFVEIMSFSKITPVTDAQPFFRDVQGRIGKMYRPHFVEDIGDIYNGIDIQSSSTVTTAAPGYQAKLRAGFIDSDNRYIKECSFARIEHHEIESLPNHFQPHITKSRTRLPNPRLQYTKVYVQVDTEPQDYFFREQLNRNGRPRHRNLYLRFRMVHRIATTSGVRLIPGVLVITGPIAHKHIEFVFLSGESKGRVRIPDRVWKRFHDDDQITQWQEKAFPVGKRKGHLRNGDPVFFLTDENKVDEGNPDGLDFLGRAQMFRLPYDRSPKDLVPEDNRSAGLDYAEAIFGRVVDRNSKNKGDAIKGRVFFEDAVADGTKPSGGWLEEEIVPHILSSPKPTTFQHYLTQNGTQGKNNLTSYFKEDYTTIRGHKLYWHRWDDTQGLSGVRESNNHNELRDAFRQANGDQDTQHTIIQPVKPKTTFTGRVRFENLTDVELGALLSALRLPEECAHHIGMGKPLGLGSVRIKATLQLVNHEARYKKWQCTGRSDDDGQKFGTSFANAIVSHARDNEETMIQTKQGLRQIARLDTLYCLLEWKEHPNPESTQYMALGDFRDRRVLPSPHAVLCRDEPAWPYGPPHPGPVPESRPRRRSPNPQEPGAGGVPTVRREPEKPKKPKKNKKIEAQQHLVGTLYRRGEVWEARFEGDERFACIRNQEAVNEAEEAEQKAIVGYKAQFRIASQSTKDGIEAVFKNLLK